MTKVDIISGFLGAGKTTLIKKLLKEALQGEQVVLIENEFGEIGIDGGFLKDAGIEIREMNSGCICCSLVGDFTASLHEVIAQYHPDRIVIEPSGVGKLSDVIVAVQKAMEGQDVKMNSTVAVVDVQKAKMYMKNFGEFFNNQIASAGTVILSRTGVCKPEKLDQALELIRGLNPTATVITTDWNKLEGAQILATMEATGNLEDEMLQEMIAEHEAHEAEHHHHHYDENGVCSCGHHHDEDDDEDEEEHEHHHHHDEDEEEHEHHCCHHHHDEDEEEDEHEHHHHHHDDDDEDEHEHHHHHHDDEDEDEHEHHHHHHDDDDEDEHEHHCCHHHHHHHHADDVFTSWGFETPKSFTAAQLEDILNALGDSETYGVILRSKGMVPAADGDTWLYFDMVPEEHEIREGKPQVTGKICVIGSKINETKLSELFGAK